MEFPIELKPLTILSSFNVNLLINRFIVLYAFFAPISKSGTSIFSVFMILAWLVEGKFQNKFQTIKENYLSLSIFGIILYSIVALLWSSDLPFALDYIRKYWHLLVVPVILTSLDEKHLKYALSAFLFSMLISEIFSYGIFFEIWSYKNVLPTMPTPFMDHANYSIYLAFTAFLLLYKILTSADLKSQVAYGAFLLMSTSNLFINGGRTGQLAFLICLIIFAVFRFEKKIRAAFIMGVVTIAIFVSAYTISPNFKQRMDYTAIDIKEMVVEKKFDKAFSIRVALWIMGVHQYLDNPFLGTGIGDEAIGARKYADQYDFKYFVDLKEDTKYIDFHNGYIQFAVSMGIGGISLFLFLLYRLLTQKFQDRNAQELNTIFASLVILLSVIGPSLHIMASMVFFALFAGLFSGIAKNNFKI